MLSVKNLSVALSGSAILKDVSLDAGSGRVTALLGPNGSGKSTLLKAILGVIKKTGGKIAFKDTDFASIDLKARARICSCVHQNVLFSSPYTVLEYVLMGRYPHLGSFDYYGLSDYRMAREMIKRVGLAGFEERIVTTLSGGEAARTAIAQALTQDSPVMLLDEPTAALDPRHSMIVSEIIGELAAEKRVVLMAVHDVNMALDCSDRLIFLKNGAVYKDMDSRDITGGILRDVYDIPWEILPVGNDGRRAAIPVRNLIGLKYAGEKTGGLIDAH
ncbi:MAG: ABC transporter ATP-binding protein [Synergistaceae bacterium]|jgi:iron complex transport system ATP-binding protein|nr:ABC transporter ATP-binding protein [Synergistaceae bacterium]